MSRAVGLTGRPPLVPRLDHDPRFLREPFLCPPSRTAGPGTRPRRDLCARSELRAGAHRPVGGHVRDLEQAPRPSHGSAARQHPHLDTCRRPLSHGAREGGRQGLGALQLRRALRGPHAPARADPRSARGDHGPHLLGVGQVTHPRVRRTPARRAHGALLRPDPRPAPGTQASRRSRPVPHPDRGAPHPLPLRLRTRPRRRQPLDPDARRPRRGR